MNRFEIRDDCMTGAEAIARARAARARLWGRPAAYVAPPPPSPPSPPSPALIPKQPAPPVFTPASARRPLAEVKSLVPGSISEIVDITAAYFNIRRDDILGVSRKRKLVFARSIAMHVASVVRRRSLAEIGRIMCKDHTTVLHDHRRIKTGLANGNMKIAAAVKTISDELQRRQALRPPPIEPPIIKPRSGPYTEEETECLLKAFHDGESMAAVARKLDRNLSAIWRKLKKMGLSRKATKAA